MTVNDVQSNVAKDLPDAALGGQEIHTHRTLGDRKSVV